MTQREVFFRLISFLRPFAWRVMAAVLLGVVTILTSIGLLMSGAWLVSTAGLQLGAASLGLAPTAVRGFGLGRGFFRYGENLLNHDVMLRILAEMRVWFYERVEPLAPARLSEHRSGDLMARVVADVDELQNFFIRVVAPPMIALIIAVIMTLVFAAFDVWASLTLLTFILLAAIALPYFAWWQGQHPGQQMVKARADLNAALVDAVQGMADSTAYGHTSAQLQTVRDHNATLITQETRLASLSALQNAATVMIVNGALLAILLVAVPRVDELHLALLTLGTLATFEAFTPLPLAAQHLGRELAAAERLFEIVDAEVPVNDPAASAQTADLPTSPALQIQNLRFRYAPHLPPVFDDFSLSVQAGERVAIVGASGSGKSSLVNVLLRFWEYDTGEIRLGGVDVQSLPGDVVRQQFGVMTQRTHLFNTTIAENIRLAAPDASDDAVIAAAQGAQIHEFVMSLPDGYETYVGEGGSALSGGERQRIALARVLLKDAPIWILDEATANLDAQTERAVMQAIYAAAAGRTLIMITHRLTALGDDVQRVVRLTSHQ